MGLERIVRAADGEDCVAFQKIQDFICRIIASSLSCEEICKTIGADSLGYLKIEDFSKMVGDLPLCRACFDRKYPV